MAARNDRRLHALEQSARTRQPQRIFVRTETDDVWRLNGEVTAEAAGDNDVLIVICYGNDSREKEHGQ